MLPACRIQRISKGRMPVGRDRQDACLPYRAHCCVARTHRKSRLIPVVSASHPTTGLPPLAERVGPRGAEALCGRGGYAEIVIQRQMMTKEKIADALEEIATLLELKDENPFKIRAYQNAARSIEAF